MIKLEIYKDKNPIDVTGIVKSVSWGGDINTFPRNIEVELHNTTDKDKGKRAVNFDVGNMVILYNDGVELFRGYIFKRTIQSEGTESFTAYDQLIYVTKNTETVIIKNKTASQVILEQLKKFGMKVGSIQPTQYKLPKLPFQAKALSDIWEEVLENDKKRSGKSYHIYSSKGLVYMVTRASATKSTISIKDVITGSQEVSIEDTRTQVVVSKGQFDPKPPKEDPEEDEYDFGFDFGDDEEGEEEEKKKAVPYQEVSASNKDAIKKYGIMQHYEDVDDETSTSEMRNQAKIILAKLSKPTVTSSIEFIGNVECITGRKIEVKDEMTGLVGSFYITSDSHTFSDGVHKMSLQLSKNLE